MIERLFKHNRKLGSRDRKFVAETVYEMVRWWRLLWFLSGSPEQDLTSKTLQPASLWRLFGVWLLWRDQTLPSWREFSGLSREQVLRNLSDAQKQTAIRESIPDWLYELGLRELGEPQWSEDLRELNQQAPVVLRANRLKTTRDALQKRLLSEDIETRSAPQTEDGLILKERRNIFTSPSFKDGLFEIQDGASQQVAPLLNLEPGLRVIDACAGAGGKTLHIAALMKNKGKIISMDIFERKLEELRKRCRRAGVDIVETRLIESAKTIKRLEKSADRVLLDVPCSGMGVLRRNPDSKWKMKPEELARLIEIQKQILADYSKMVKVGGRLVYATCSIIPSENEKQVQAFLKDHETNWRFIEEHKFRPGEDGYDGFYAAVLERTQ